MVVLGVLAAAAGVLWQVLASPPRWEVTGQGVVLAQEQAQKQVGVELLFLAVGLVLCGLWGIVAGWAAGAAGWILAPVFVVAGLAAAVLAWQVGVLTGPPDPATVTGLSVGDSFPDQLRRPSFGPLLAWPAAAVGGLVLGLLLTPQGRLPAGADESLPD